MAAIKTGNQIHYVKIVITYIFHSQQPHDPNTPTLSKVNI
jgi:hypothetical protein